MANPQVENGFTKIANELVEALMKVNLSAYEHRVLWFLFRKTYGWEKKTDWIALSQFSQCIDLDRRHVHRAIKGLSSKKMIVIERDDGVRIKYGFQKDYDKWIKVSSKKMTVTYIDDGLSSNQAPKVSSNQAPTKEKKKHIQNKGDVLVLPKEVNPEIWKSFLDMRKLLRKPPTHRAQELLLKKLMTMDGDKNKIIEQSIMNSWQGFFTLKDQPKSDPFKD